jgi:hypothetical protein
MEVKPAAQSTQLTAQSTAQPTPMVAATADGSTNSVLTSSGLQMDLINTEVENTK